MGQRLGMIGFVLCWSIAAAAEPEAPAAAEAPAAVEAPAVEVREVLWNELVVKHRAAPRYPPEAFAQRASGDCAVRLFIDERGKTTSVEVLTCPPVFVEAAKTAAMSTSFYPFKDASGPAPVSTVTRYKFKISEPPPPSPPVTASLPTPPKGRVREVEFTRLRCEHLAPVTFPEEARAAGVESACGVMLYLNEEGAVVYVEPITCVEPFLTAVREATAPMVCDPVERRGAPIPVKAEYTFNFRLQ